MIVPGMLVCSSFLINVCLFIVSKTFLISSDTVIVRAGGAIWLNPFATVLFKVCSVVSRYCIFCVGYLCIVCCVFDSVCELCGETIRNVFGCGCYFVAECYGGVEYGLSCSVR